MARIFDIVQYIDETATEMVHRIPERGSGDFRIGSQVIVRESQAAVFFRDGRSRRQRIEAPPPLWSFPYPGVPPVQYCGCFRERIPSWVLLHEN